MNASVWSTSFSGSGGLPSTKENSGITPNPRMRTARSRVISGVRVPPLSMRARVSLEPDSAPRNTMRRPLSRIARQVESLNFSRVSMRPSPHQFSFKGAMRSAIPSAALLVGEEVVVVELDRVDLPFARVAGENAFDPFGRLGIPSSPGEADYAAEVAQERTAVARVIPERPLAEEGRARIGGHVDLLERKIRKIFHVRARARPRPGRRSRLSARKARLLRAALRRGASRGSRPSRKTARAESTIAVSPWPRTTKSTNPEVTQVSGCSVAK